MASFQIESEMGRVDGCLVPLDDRKVIDPPQYPIAEPLHGVGGAEILGDTITSRLPPISG